MDSSIDDYPLTCSQKGRKGSIQLEDFFKGGRGMRVIKQPSDNFLHQLKKKN